jgi:hypothetical protein
LARAPAPTPSALSAPHLTVAAWKTKPSCYVVAIQDGPLRELQRSTAHRAETTEAPGSHVAFLTQPNAVADVIAAAARGAGAGAKATGAACSVGVAARNLSGPRPDAGRAQQDGEARVAWPTSQADRLVSRWRAGSDQSLRSDQDRCRECAGGVARASRQPAGYRDSAVSARTLRRKGLKRDASAVEHLDGVNRASPISALPHWPPPNFR